MREEVVPWLMDRVMMLLQEDQAVLAGAEVCVVDGIIDSQMEHRATLNAREAAKKQAQVDKIKAEEDKVKKREQRKQNKIIAEKNKKLAEWKDAVENKVIFCN